MYPYADKLRASKLGRIHLCNWNRHLRCRVPLHGGGGPYFLQQHPSGSYCPAWLRRAVSSAWHSRPKRLQLAHIGHVYATIRRLVFVEGCIRDAVLAADIDYLRARLPLLQYPDDVFFREP